MSEFRTTEVYKITNTKNGKAYVGIAVAHPTRPNRRWNSHVHDAKRGVDYPLYRAIRKYGKGAFERESLFYCGSWEDAEKAENKMIKYYRTHVSEGGYNVTWGGQGCVGRQVSDDTRQKMREAKLGKPGIPWTEERRKKFLNSVSNNGRVYPKGGDHQCAKEVVVFGKKYSSQVEARKELGLTRKQLYRRIYSDKYPEFQLVENM